ncbi:MAG: FAD-dependent oxidoreductase [Gammaproteobacteria bacterium]|nr:FAD-dependent oxidoreductase [Gammaproteobacteria bacterium]
MLSKGVHIVVARDKLPLAQMVMTITADKRPVFMIPRGQVVYIGTTDSRYEQTDTWPEVLPEEIDYLLEVPRDYCGVDLSREDCLTTWAGLRPLISQTGKSTREISRKDEIWVSNSGLITIAGGKLTGYRKMAEDTVDEACKIIGYAPPEVGRERPLPGGDFDVSVAELARDLTQTWPMPDDRAQRLVSLYDAESKEVLTFGDEEVVDGAGLIVGEVHWAITREGAHSVEDILYRRTRASYYLPTHVPALIEPVTRLAARTLDWSDDEQSRQIEAMRARFEADHDGLYGSSEPTAYKK